MFENCSQLIIVNDKNPVDFLSTGFLSFTIIFPLNVKIIVKLLKVL